MLISGIPYSEPALQQTQSGGTPYGASHISGSSGKDLTADEIQICQALGRSIAELSLKLG
jgi:NAD(P)H dehydrogenase (quinone)